MGIIKLDKFYLPLERLKKFTHPFLQIAVVIIFSLLPLLLTAMSIASQDSARPFFSEFIKLLESGSVFIYVSAFLAPYFYSLIFEGGFRTRLYVMVILLLALWSLVVGALLFSGYVGREWGGRSFPHYIEWSVFLPALITWHYTLYGRVGGSSNDHSQKDVETAIRDRVANR